ncbi:MAG: hypothetical protein F4Z06_15410 [Acidimicrobiia bacterium]|nr:hypothetical protein [Acidimicrobiia bacterium]MYE73136.1 hypothetical protein [Acidimicrobiia bacterium]MYJ61790.1 hypothetical protein [Acidimicrobiia bacterium]
MSVATAHQEMQDLIAAQEFESLFIDHLGWDRPRHQQLLPESGAQMVAHSVASKKVVDVWHVPCPTIPQAPERHRVIRRLRRLHSLEMLVIFDGEDGEMLWFWPEPRPAGDSYKSVGHWCDRNAIKEEMLERLSEAAFTLEEEPSLTVSDVLSRVRRSLGVDLVGLEREVATSVLDAAAPLSASKDCSDRIGRVLSQQGGDQSNRMAVAIMLNAVVFQHHIAMLHPDKVQSPDHVRSTGARRDLVSADWDAILDINYWPIFGIARKLLDAIGDDQIANTVLDEVYGSASEKVATQATQGLVGELFGRLIVDRKFLATYYTRPQSASFLAELAVDRLQVDWADASAVTSLRVADLACGTGALLTAVYRRIAARHEDAGGDPSSLHKKIMEDVLHGCDIMPAAVHLTAAVLSGEHPDIDYTSTRTWVMPFGVDDFGSGQETRIGSLDLLSGDQRRALFGDGTTAIEARDAPAYSEAVVPDGGFDLVIMNPPFTRPTNHENKRHSSDDAPMPPNPAFAGLGNDEVAQRLMSDSLEKVYRLGRVKKEARAGHGNAGLASNFVDLAHRKLKPGGVLALIVPVTIVSGDSWKKTRRLLAKYYEDISVSTLTSVDRSTARSFSNDTNMAEAVVIATRRSIPTDPDKGRARYLCLLRRPATNPDGIDLARLAKPGGEFDDPGGSYSGFAVSGLFTEHGGGHPSGVEDAELCVIAGNLLEGHLRLPGVATLADIPIVPMSYLGRRGPYHLDINAGGGRGPFEVVPPTKGWIKETPFSAKEEIRSGHMESIYPALWSHDSEMESYMTVKPCSTATVRDDMAKQARLLWDGFTNKKGIAIGGATRLHINNDFRFTSQPLGACLTPRPTIGGRAWPSFALDLDHCSDVELLKWEKALCVWLNSTLGLISRWWVSSRQQGGRAILTVTTVGSIPVLDLNSITSSRISVAAAAFDQFENRSLLPANEAYRDAVRHEMDEVIATEVLHMDKQTLRGIARLRDKWCREPSVHGNKPTRPPDS